ncbi:A/G-specific adenine glycosylase [Acetobacteroides hydrogenigenes]|uniref:Adenine DNA glycosylase n=1 Tax=Acetobacteroides hydrogenigenes TaxID=979970 RepID=A0A4R2EYM2_9BACT|nr:A/G-specific adenine glycosylase [Acetobacteroides hydrogenigenes]TCN73037.1 A/G-specific adenine glycosylase [Acetobacteroides hydrogenigenes]
MIFSQVLVKWYAANKRILPWRETGNPYYIWVSEVILQQTRVAQGIDYYIRFINTFPTVYDLAHADIDRVLKVWQGLGYYTRARNMHATAKEIVDNHKGAFPRTYQELIKLKGIGDYTASAIAAFAFGEAVAAVDGNVYRIFARLFGIDTPIDTQKGKLELKVIANSMLDRENPGVYNQAIMDFGGTVCTPKRPNCFSCPVMEICSAFRNRKVDQYPVKSKTIKKTERYLTYIIPQKGSQTYIAKRVNDDIWKSLYEFPLIETDRQMEVDEIVETDNWAKLFEGKAVDVLYFSSPKKYLLSHQRIFARFVVVRMDEESQLLKEKFSAINLSEIHNYSTSRLIEGFLAAEPVEKYFKKSTKD